MPAILKRSGGGSTALIAAAVVSCIAAALITLCILWFYHRWLRRKQATPAKKERSPTPASSYPPPPVYPQPRAPRRNRHKLITKPSIPDLPRISEERLSLASVSPSVQSRPATMVGSGAQGEPWRAAVERKEREEMMGPGGVEGGEGTRR